MWPVLKLINAVRGGSTLYTLKDVQFEFLGDLCRLLAFFSLSAKQWACTWEQSVTGLWQRTYTTLTLAFRDILTVWLRGLPPVETCSRPGSQPSQPALLPTILLKTPYFLIKLEGFLLLPLPPPCCLTSVVLPWSYHSHFLQCPCTPKWIYSHPTYSAHPNSSTRATLM